MSAVSVAPVSSTGDRRVPSRDGGVPSSPGGATDAALEKVVAAGLASAHLRSNLRRVLADLSYPAHRWQVVCEAEAWGVSDVVRRRLVALPEARYPHLDAILHALTTVGRRPVRRR